MSEGPPPRTGGFSGLWRHPDFLRFWAGQTVSQLGSRVTVLALPLTAVLTLHATAGQMGVLEAAGSAASLVFGLPAGVQVDRRRRRPLMIAASLGQGVVLFSVPVAAWLGVLRLPQLFVVSFLAAAFTVFFSAARRAYLVSLVPRDRLVEANSKLALTGSAAQLAGPGLGGLLIQLLTAPAAIAADSVSFVTAALSLAAIRAPEPAAPPPEGTGLRQEVAEGWWTIVSDRRLRALAGASATFNLFDSVLFAVYVLYMTRTLGLSPGTIGLVFGLAGAGGLLGAVVAARLSARLGLGRAIFYGIVLASAGELVIVGAGGPQLVAALILVGAEGLVELGAALYVINAGSLQQAIPPERLLGRVGATSDLITLGAAPLGALAGGLLGQSIGLRATVAVAGVGTLLSLLWIGFSPLGRTSYLETTA